MSIRLFNPEDLLSDLARDCGFTVGQYGTIVSKTGQSVMLDDSILVNDETLKSSILSSLVKDCVCEVFGPSEKEDPSTIAYSGEDDPRIITYREDSFLKDLPSYIILHSTKKIKSVDDATRFFDCLVGKYIKEYRAVPFGDEEFEYCRVYYKLLNNDNEHIINLEDEYATVSQFGRDYSINKIVS